MDIPLDIRIYGTLALVVLLYAVFLQLIHHKERLEPDYTWLEVVIGVTMCLAAAAYRGRHVSGGWKEYEGGAWLAFIVGGGVIILWQIGQSVARQREVRQRGRIDATQMAEKCRVRPPGDD